RLYRFAVVSAVLHGFILAQAPAPGAQPPRVMWANLAQPPVPADPLELVTGNAQPVQDVNQRAAIISLLSNAKALSNVRAYPYDLKTSFTAMGSPASDGAWQLENVSPGRGFYRWTAEGPGYSVVNLYKNTLLYSSQPNGTIPLRLAQVRAAIFYVNSIFGPHASIRTAPACLKGMELTCALTERMTPPKTAVGGRLWDESEFCVDPKTGFLITYSPVPGLYVLYDYSNALHFHDRIIPGKFTITEAGRNVIEARTESVADPTNVEPSLFNPANLTSVGVGPLETPPWNVRSHEYGQVDMNGTVALQVVVLHAMASPDGHLTDAEVLGSSDSGLNQRALERLAKWQNWRGSSDAQPGASPQSHEVYFTFEFAVSGA